MRILYKVLLVIYKVIDNKMIFVNFLNKQINNQVINKIRFNKISFLLMIKLIYKRKL